ncbi:MAG: hypothetical protein GQE15_13140 [Archangiaceae bacterium]|nr:hypothetical protein [Archangiaceae bacterium]
MALQIKVASPCSEKWESMRGDERRRFCEKCQLHVHDLRSLSEAEATELLRGASGRVCGRVFQRADGTVMTKDCPVGVATRRRRMAMSVVAVAALFVAVAGVLTGGGSRGHHDGEPAPVSDALRERYRAAKESLRATALFGPIINRFDPAPPPMMVGKIVAMPPKTGS